MDCARRELAEETGYAADVWQKLAEITPVPGYSDERVHLFLASGLKAARQALDPDEVLAVHRVTLARAVEMIAQGISRTPNPSAAYCWPTGGSPVIPRAAKRKSDPAEADEQATARQEGGKSGALRWQAASLEPIRTFSLSRS